jgi:hypothetical protein
VQTYSNFTTHDMMTIDVELGVGARAVAEILGSARAPQEAVTADTIRTGKPEHSARQNLNSDGRPHPLLNAASFFTLIVGLLSFALGLFIRTGPSGEPTWAVVAAATGLTALLVRLVSQMMSATREERVIIVTGLTASFIGLALGLAHGGFS